MTTKIKLESSAVKQLAKILNDTGLSEIEYEDQGCRIRVVKHPEPSFSPHFAAFPQSNVVGMPAPTVPVHAAPSPSVESVMSSPVLKGDTVRSPMVGTAYLASEPGAAPFVKVGDSVKPGDTLLIIEAMKVMNPIKAQKAGVVQEILITDASPVEFDEALIVLV